MTISVGEFRKIEQGLVYILKSEFWLASDDEIEDFLQNLRRYLKDRGIRIEPREDANQITTIVFPEAITMPEKVHKRVVTTFKLSEADREYIQQSRESNEALAKKFDVSATTIAKNRGI